MRNDGLLTMVCLGVLALGNGCVTGEWRVRTAAMERPARVLVVPPGEVGAARLRAAEASVSSGEPAPSVVGGLDEARQRVRELRGQGVRGEIIVGFRGGEYRLSKAVEFGKEDSGTPEGRVVYRAEPGERVTLTGGVEVRGFEPLTDESLLSQLVPEARGKVLVADLRAQGITEYGKLERRGFGQGGTPLAEAELFYDDKPMRLSRWPKSGFMGALSKDETDTRVVLDAKGRVARWRGEKDPWLFAYWHFDWAELYEPIRGFGEKADEVVRDAKIVPPLRKLTPSHTRAYGLNLFCELSEPGEYYLDREGGRLYFIPPHPGGRAVLTQAPQLVTLKDVSEVSFEGLVFEYARGTLMTIRGGAGVQVVGCVMRNAGHAAVSGSGSRHELYGLDVYGTGEGGLSLSGGDRKTLTDGKNTIENCHVHHYSRRARTYRTGIRTDGCGNRLAHNLIHHGPHMAIAAGGNNHLVEFNEIHNAVYESGDAGAYYVGRDWTQRGNVLRHNYWHHIKGSSSFGGMTIYLDDQHCGHTIYGNLFERCNQSVFIGGGDDNIVDNNVFVDCWKSAHLDNRGMGWQKKATDDPNGELRRYLRNMPYKSEVWARAYPTLVSIEEDDPGVPKRNVFRRNVSAGGKFYDIAQSIAALQTVEANVVHDEDETWIRLRKDASGKVLGISYRDEGELKAVGFEPLPVERMGLYRDSRRASWPVRHEIEEVSLPSERSIRAERERERRKYMSTMPTLTVPQSADGTQAGRLTLGVTERDASVSRPPQSRVWHDGASLHVVVETPLTAKRKLGDGWAGVEACELALMASDGANAEIHVLRGFTTGKFEGFRLLNGRQGKEPLLSQVTYGARVGAEGWTCEWTVPLSVLGVRVNDRLRANVTVRRTADNVFAMWRATHGDSTNCDIVGFWELASKAK